MTQPDTAPLRALAAEVCARLSEYIDVLAQSPEDPTLVIPAMTRVEETATAFAAASVETVGWGNPFVPSPFDD
jgi:hypothetical protein